MKWNDVLEKQNELEKKKELVTIRNTVDGLVCVANCSATYEEFVKNLKELLAKLEEMVAK